MSLRSSTTISSLGLVLLVVMCVWGSDEPLPVQMAENEIGAPQDEQSRPAINKTAGRLPPTTPLGRPALGIIRETVDTNIVAWSDSKGFGGKLDWLHAKLFRTAQAPVEMVDHWFRPGRGELRLIELSRFRVGVFGQGVIRNNKIDITGALDYDADVELPNMKRQTKFVLTTRDQTALPGKDVSEERDRSVRTAIERQWWPAVSTSVGMRTRLPPDLFAKVSWSPKWKAGDWLLYPQQKAYWLSSDGFGEISTLVADHWNDGWNIRFTTSIKCSQKDWKSDQQVDRKDNGFRWSEVFMFGYAREFLDETGIERIVAGDDVARGLGIRLAAFGGFNVVDEYRAGVFARWPIRKRWMYLLVAPDVSWMQANDWEHEWTIRCGLETLFWGSKSR